MASRHRRGGKHDVKDKNLTHTKYNDYSPEELLAAVKEAGCDVRDDMKIVMAKKMAGHARNLNRKETRMLQERKRKETQQRQETKYAANAAQRRATARRNRDRNRRRRRREFEENVSSDSDDTKDLHERDKCAAHELTVTGGEPQSDDAWEETCSETTVRSMNPCIVPDCRLRLFEWPYTIMPSCHSQEDRRSELFPSPLIYIPLKLVTMRTQEKVMLLGVKYPSGVELEFHPILDPLTRAAARHGHTIGLLANAIIERTSWWAERSIVAGWHGRMYFSLSQTGATDEKIDAVYLNSSSEQSNLLKATPGATDIKADRGHRRALHLALKRRTTTKVYEVCKSVPLALGYALAYLDWQQSTEVITSQYDEQTLENMYYIRSPGCDLPHYYFWKKRDGWCDPTTPDPFLDQGFSEQQNRFGSMDACTPRRLTKLRVKTLTTPPLRPNGSSETEHLGPTVSSIEHDLITYGLSVWFAKCRSLAVSAHKEDAWKVFINEIPILFPSGALPCTPPSEGINDMCLAETIVRLLSGREVQPFSETESGTRGDDAFREAISCLEDEDAFPTDDSNLGEPQYFAQFLPGSAIEDKHASAEQALHRHDSSDTSQDTHIWTWLENINIVYPSHLLPPSPPPSPPIYTSCLLPKSSNSSTTDIIPTCPFCSTPWTHLSPFQQAQHMLSHSSPALPLVTTATSRISAIGVRAKRRHSLLSARTLESYHVNARKGRKVLRVDSAASLVEAWVGLGKEQSPFSKEVRRGRRDGLERASAV